MYGDGNSTKMIKDITSSVTQVMSGIKDSTGIDLGSVVSGLLGGKMALRQNKEQDSVVIETKVIEVKEPEAPKEIEKQEITDVIEEKEIAPEEKVVEKLMKQKQND